MELLLLKDKEYIYEKEDKVKTEIKYLENLGKGSTGIVGLGVYGSDETMKIKKYQMKILDWLKTANMFQIKQVYNREKKLMCISCQGGLPHGELKCGHCTKRFIFCDMMRRSLRSLI